MKTLSESFFLQFLALFLKESEENTLIRIKRVF